LTTWLKAAFSVSAVDASVEESVVPEGAWDRVGTPDSMPVVLVGIGIVSEIPTV
jgi:hypothetical protein